MSLSYQERQDITNAIVRWFNCWQAVLRDWARPEATSTKSVDDSIISIERMNGRDLNASAYRGASALLDAQIATSCGVEFLRSAEPP